MNELIKQQLINEVTQMMQKSHPELELKLQTTSKNNGQERESITFYASNKELTASPNIYLDEAISKIQSGEFTIIDAAEMICRIYEANQSESISAEVNKLLNNPDYSRIIPEVVNKSMNEDLLKSTPHRELAPDIVMIARYQFTEDGTSIISEGLASKLLLTGKEVLDIAERNIQNQGYKVEDMQTVIASMIGVPAEEVAIFTEGTVQEQMLVITNESKVYGAAGVFVDENLRAEIRDRLDGDFYILPSSIHECIAVRADAMSPEAATNMVVEVNCNELASEEVLANNAFFVGESLKIEIAGAEKEVSSEAAKQSSAAHM